MTGDPKTASSKVTGAFDIFTLPIFSVDGK